MTSTTITTIDQTTIDQTTIDQTTTDTSGRRPAHRIRRTLGTLVAMVSLSGAAMAVGSQSAEAATWVRSGSYGGVTLQPVVGQYVSQASNGTVTRYPGLAITGPYVTRSNATSGAQTVWVQANIEQWYGNRWVHVRTTGFQGYTIAAGQQGRWIPTIFVQTGSGTYRVSSLGVYWQDASYRNLGGFVAAYNSSGDYRCGIAACRVGPGYVTL
jgi:hypothetical protein